MTFAELDREILNAHQAIGSRLPTFGFFVAEMIGMAGHGFRESSAVVPQGAVSRWRLACELLRADIAMPVGRRAESAWEIMRRVL